MHLMVQPVVASILLRDRLLADQGFLSRLLISAPDSAMGTRMSHNEAPDTPRDLNLYDTQLLQILNTPLPLAPGKNNELQPRQLPFNSAAQIMWSRFADHIECEIRPGGGLELVKGLANKLPEHAARLAAVITLVSNIHAVEIAEAKLAAGIEVAQHYAAEALRLHDASWISEGLRRAKQLLEWLLTHWEPGTDFNDVLRGRAHAGIKDVHRVAT
jgi:hypothetical protein